MPPDADPRSALTEVEARPGSRKPDPILVMDNVSRSFGGLLAVSVDHLETQRGTITAQMRIELRNPRSTQRPRNESVRGGRQCRTLVWMVHFQYTARKINFVFHFG